jgi:hypothetical protein
MVNERRRVMVGRMTDAQKARQRSKEINDLYKQDYTTRAKRFYNEQNYSRQLGGGSAMRITVPALEKSHIDNAIRHFEILVAELKALKKVSNAPAWQPDETLAMVGLMRMHIYSCHRNLKQDADRSYSHPNRGYEDFRGAR